MPSFLPSATRWGQGKEQEGGMDEDDYEEILRWREGMEEPEEDPWSEPDQQEDDDVEKIVNDFLGSHPAKGR